MVIELREKGGAQPVLQAIEAYKVRLKAGIERSKRQLAKFEQHYGVDTGHFLQTMAAEDLDGGDLEYVEWAGEARLLEGLEAELTELDHAHFSFPWLVERMLPKKEHRVTQRLRGDTQRETKHPLRTSVISLCSSA
ncbi:MAG: hypothetical protein HC875_40295 [Anaerolineales bacterium]|nr:hypothetical protein [Anaerolineales bacterium]